MHGGILKKGRIGCFGNLALGTAGRQPTASYKQKAFKNWISDYRSGTENKTGSASHVHAEN
ncbi:hypothetical protein A3860_01195 [Niastella vici]|uniref:Uncharacterized protein n=1 Tax=Niastella vici TaxID=1703345 RepID=A0A1V9G8Y4_9BACT|nr:hypothetical protein A3860_01195 [Niastella vici]